MVNQVHERRQSKYFVIYGRPNGDDSALGQDRRQNKKPFEGRERMKF